MPTESTTEHDFLQNRFLQDHTTVKEFCVAILNEREKKYENRFASIEKAIDDTNEAIKNALSIADSNTKDALAISTANTKDALGAANTSLQAALVSLDKRFDSVNEFRGQLADQATTFVRKEDIYKTMEAFEKAVAKAEAGTEKRFESVNEFRAQMAD